MRSAAAARALALAAGAACAAAATLHDASANANHSKILTVAGAIFAAFAGDSLVVGNYIKFFKYNLANIGDDPIELVLPGKHERILCTSANRLLSTRSPFAHYVISTSRTVHWWDPNDAQFGSKSINLEATDVRCTDMTKNGSHALIKYQHPNSGRFCAKVLDLNTGSFIGKDAKGMPCSMSSAPKFSHVGKNIVLVKGNELQLWSPITQKFFKKVALKMTEATHVACSPDGRSLVILGYHGTNWMERRQQLQIFNLFDQKFEKDFGELFPSSKIPFNLGRISNDGRYALTASRSTVLVLDLRTHKLAAKIELAGHSEITSVDISGDGKFVFANADAVHVWKRWEA